jgi:signal transduction histidine kinase
MAQLHPATQLLIIQSLFLVLGVPLMAWFSVVRGRADRAARCWYAGIALLGLGVLVAAVLLRVTGFVACVLTLSVLVCTAAIRIEAGRAVIWPRWLTPVYLIWCAWYVVIDEQGLWLRWGVPTLMFTLSVLYAHLIVLLMEMGRRHRSRGLLLVGLGVGLIGVMDAFRGFTALIQGKAGAILSFSIDANAVIVAVTLSAVLMALGYAAFILEKLHALRLKDAENTARAEEKSRLAELHAQELEDIIHQRDAMIMLNSRFSAVNSLSIYNSAIVHEISQPLQGVQTIVDKLAIKAEHYAPVLTSDIGAIAKMVEQIASVLAALRKLISAQTPRQELLLLDEVLRDIGPIMKNEASRRSIRFGYECPNAESPLRVQVNRVLFERVLFNLVANALQALAGSRPVNPFVQIQVAPVRLQDMDCVLIRVEDNGTGFPSEVIGAGGKPLITSKAGGAGIGLALARIIVESWRGCLKLSNQSEPGRTGALVEITLPAH